MAIASNGTLMLQGPIVTAEDGNDVLGIAAFNPGRVAFREVQLPFGAVAGEMPGQLGIQMA
eukprot:SAG22_NODE_20966_length_261_cov_0.635802_1_plen_60_part_10